MHGSGAFWNLKERGEDSGVLCFVLSWFFEVFYYLLLSNPFLNPCESIKYIYIPPGVLHWSWARWWAERRGPWHQSTGLFFFRVGVEHDSERTVIFVIKKLVDFGRQHRGEGEKGTLCILSAFCWLGTVVYILTTASVFLWWLGHGGVSRHVCFLLVGGYPSYRICIASCLFSFCLVCRLCGAVGVLAALSTLGGFGTGIG